MKPSRIVLVLMEPPLPFGNAAARWYYVLVKGLAERGHRVTTFAACSRSEDADAAQLLFADSDYDLRCYLHPARHGLGAKWESLRRPHSYVFAPQLRRDLEAVLAKGFDVLHLEMLWSGWLGLHHCDRSVLNIHYLFEVDLADAPFASLADRLRRMAAFRAERRLLRRYRTITTLTPRLTARVGEIAPRANVQTVPLAFDLALYPFDPAPPQSDTQVVGLIGSFKWHPTYSAAVRLLTRLWPAINRQVSHARLQIVGRDARRTLGAFVDTPNTTILEDVPEIVPYFASTDVMLYAPVRGSGMKVKVMEAFAFGTPVVTTTDGIEGIPAEDGVHAGVCDDDEGLIERTVSLLRNNEQRLRQRRAARELIERHCDPVPALDLLEAVYATCA